MGELGKLQGLSLHSLLSGPWEGPEPFHICNFVLFFLNMVLQFYKIQLPHTYIYPW